MTSKAKTAGFDGGSGDVLRTRATHAPHRANLRCLGLSVGIAIALAGCARPSTADEQLLGLIQKQQAVSQQHTMLMAKMVIILERQQNRIDALEAASAGEADRPKRGETRGSVHEHAVGAAETPQPSDPSLSQGGVA